QSSRRIVNVWAATAETARSQAKITATSPGPNLSLPKDINASLECLQKRQILNNFWLIDRDSGTRLYYLRARFWFGDGGNQQSQPSTTNRPSLGNTPIEPGTGGNARTGLDHFWGLGAGNRCQGGLRRPMRANTGQSSRCAPGK